MTITTDLDILDGVGTVVQAEPETKCIVTGLEVPKYSVGVEIEENFLSMHSLRAAYISEFYQVLSPETDTSCSICTSNSAHQFTGNGNCDTELMLCTDCLNEVASKSAIYIQENPEQFLPDLMFSE